MDNIIIQKPGKYFTDSEKHKIIEELLSSRCTRQSLWEKYTGEKEEHGYLVRWMRALGYSVAIKTRKSKLASDFVEMPEKIKRDIESEEFENLQLKKRIAELEKQLKDAEMKAIAFSTMVDIAEKEFKIPIRKKLNTKP
jgi:transposase